MPNMKNPIILDIKGVIKLITPLLDNAYASTKKQSAKRVVNTASGIPFIAGSSPVLLTRNIKNSINKALINIAENIMHALLNMNFDHIAIRDMFVNTDTNTQIVPVQMLKILEQKTSKERVDDFSRFWGKPIILQRYIHYLLKYRYVDNWDREVRENYLPVDIEPFLNMVSQYYNIECLDHYTLPFLKEQIQKDIGITLDIPTHAKILLSKR